MSTHNICFREEIRKISAFFGWKKRLICCYVKHTMAYNTLELCTKNRPWLCAGIVPVDNPLDMFCFKNNVFILKIITTIIDFSRPMAAGLGGWMHRPTGDQEVTCSTPAEVGNILSRRLIMKYFQRSFSPFCWFKKGSCQILAKECTQYWLTA